MVFPRLRFGLVLYALCQKTGLKERMPKNARGVYRQSYCHCNSDFTIAWMAADSVTP
jgi:hypothetical protein